MINEGKHFRFLIINPKPNEGSDEKKEPEWFRDSQGKILHHDISHEVDAVLKRFRDDIVGKFVDKLTPSELVARFDVREYNLPITHTMIIIDPDTPNGKIHFEPFTYVPEEGATPVFIIEKSKQPEVFKNLLESFKNAYEQAIPVDWEKLGL